MTHNWLGSLKRGQRRTGGCPPGFLAVWSGPARTGVRCLIPGTELRDGPIRTFGRTVQNRTGQPVQVADQSQVISTMAASNGLLELSYSRGLTLCEPPEVIELSAGRLDHHTDTPDDSTGIPGSDRRGSRS